MRRLFGLMAACALLALSATGCYHTAGVCDCDQGCAHGLLGVYEEAALHIPAFPHTSAPAQMPKAPN
jgi:hypothetical protein